MKTAAILLAPITLAAAGATAAPPPGVTIVRLGETVRVHGLRLTPLRVLEDSRCPAGVTCVWAGRVRIALRIGGAIREVTLGQPEPMPGGTLGLASVLPQMNRTGKIPPGAYRFGIRFSGNAGMQLIRD